MLLDDRWFQGKPTPRSRVSRDATLVIWFYIPAEPSDCLSLHMSERGHKCKRSLQPVNLSKMRMAQSHLETLREESDRIELVRCIFLALLWCSRNLEWLSQLGRGNVSFLSPRVNEWANNERRGWNCGYTPESRRSMPALTWMYAVHWSPFGRLNEYLN